MGGTPRTWSLTLPDDLAPDAEAGLRLVLTKFGAPAVAVGWELRVE